MPRTGRQLDHDVRYFAPSDIEFEHAIVAMLSDNITHPRVVRCGCSGSRCLTHFRLGPSPRFSVGVACYKLTSLKTNNSSANKFWPANLSAGDSR